MLAIPLRYATTLVLLVTVGAFSVVAAAQT